MENTNLLRPRVAVLTVLLLAALAIVLVFSLNVLAHYAQFCGPETVGACAGRALRYVPWLPMAQIVLAAAAALVAMIGAPLARRRSWAARLWPLYLLLLLVGLLYVGVLLAQAAALSSDALRAGTVSGWRQFWFLLAGVSGVPSVLAVMLSWLVLACLCFTAPAGVTASRSRGRLALLFFLVFAAVPMVLYLSANIGLILFSTTDYVVFAHDYKKAAGISIEWGIFLACILSALPVWIVAYVRDSGRRGVAGTLLAALIALLLGFAFELIGVLVLAVLPSHAVSPRHVMQTAWYLLAWILVFNALAAWIACSLVRPAPAGAHGMLRGNGTRWAWGAASVLVAIVTFGFWGILLAAKLNWAGAQPAKSLLADSPPFALAASPEGNSCAGIVRAGSSLWLVGSNDDSVSDSLADIVKDPQVQNLALGPDHLPGQPPAYRTFYPTSTVLSRLEGHAFKPVAYLPGKGCLVPVPGTQRLLLLTSLQPRDGYAPQAPSLVFQTQDDGRHWQVLEPGMLATVSPDVYQSGVEFRSKDRVWAWRGRLGEAGSDPSGFGYSGDGGRTSEPLPIPADFRSKAGDVASLVPEDARASIKLDDSRGVRRFVTEISPTRAVLWLSQRFSYEIAPHRHGYIARTDALVLERAGDAWRASAVKHLDGLYIDKLAQPQSGPAYAAVFRQKQGREEIAVLDGAKVQWQDLSAAPNPFWPMGQSDVRGLWAAKNVLVVNVYAEYVAVKGTRGRSYFDEVSFSAPAKYYSNDAGRHWHKLAIAAYPGIYGLDPDTARLYFRNFNRRTYVSPFFAFELGTAK
ncbi:hypothetical protein KVP10_07285 [Candidimonas humi]|uniref:Uncharacterized protein n=1 Tax=Candidimonas humi TaxID=683355 RepID=A0ABV8NZI3_9BURK|nr:hypothetical protein [Candidimonas humi]MBV6304686.1 hypothetical protein [Candidimonas humi]